MQLVRAVLARLHARHPGAALSGWGFWRRSRQLAINDVAASQHVRLHCPQKRVFLGMTAGSKLRPPSLQVFSGTALAHAYIMTPKRPNDTGIMQVRRCFWKGHGMVCPCGWLHASKPPHHARVFAAF